MGYGWRVQIWNSIPTGYDFREYKGLVMVKLTRMAGKVTGSKTLWPRVVLYMVRIVAQFLHYLQIISNISDLFT
jgi:hypothetical protein